MSQHSRAGLRLFRPSGLGHWRARVSPPVLKPHGEFRCRLLVQLMTFLLHLHLDLHLAARRDLNGLAGCPTHPRGPNEWVCEGEGRGAARNTQMGRAPSVRDVTESRDSGAPAS